MYWHQKLPVLAHYRFGGGGIGGGGREMFAACRGSATGEVGFRGGVGSVSGAGAGDPNRGASRGAGGGGGGGLGESTDVRGSARRACRSLKRMTFGPSLIVSPSASVVGVVSGF